MVLFFGAVLLMLRYYRLDPRRALALRPVKPVVWLAVVLGAPAGILTGVGLFRVVNIFLPVPPRVLEEFSRALLFWKHFSASR